MTKLELPQVQWHRISPRHIAVSLVSNVIWLLVCLVATVVIWVLADGLWWLITAWMVVVSIVEVAMVVPRNRAIGYAVREDDLLVRRGVMFNSMTAVPYGRMQTVSMHRGPIDRMLGLASLRMSTASAGASVSIPGLPLAEAERLRDHLIRVAETRRAGL
ncbi:PH domain-containing protein [uncultured Gulosibacter sp.]|uniref:PH domain-containing protein n=1 Tax=uncultured Gulosibacter sp. TaxID=1339167 RepID=UPI00288AFCD0|nr:PH domain-containing protein [uncultured Gulosibacter sp.]